MLSHVRRPLRHLVSNFVQFIRCASCKVTPVPALSFVFRASLNHEHSPFVLAKGSRFGILTCGPFRFLPRNENTVPPVGARWSAVPGPGSGRGAGAKAEGSARPFGGPSGQAVRPGSLGSPGSLAAPRRSGDLPKQPRFVLA